MTDTPTTVNVCCCGNCETAGHEQVTNRPLTASEITVRENDVAEYAARKAAEEAEAAEVAAAKASATDKLKALGLSDEEISALSK